VSQIRTPLFAALLLTKDKERTEGDMGWSLRTFILPRALAIVAMLAARPALTQVAAAGQVVQPQTVVDILHQLSDKAEIVFAGQVLAIRRPSDGLVEVEFRVDQAIRGCTTGTPYILREWAGLWAGDNQRYRVGQRLLMLLHAPSAAGMSSPVGGLDGAIPIREGSAAMASEDDLATPPQPPYVDLRWLGARLPHAVIYQSEPVRADTPVDLQPHFSGQLAGQGIASNSINGLVTINPAFDKLSASEASVPAQQASVNAVISMLSSWQSPTQKAQHVAP
jgi:hypothetical protein